MKRFIGLALALAGLSTASCNGESPLCTSSDFNAATGVIADFGTDGPAAKVEAFLSATSSLVIEINDVESELLAACTAIATDLGVPASELAPADPNLPGARVQAACHRAAEEIRATIEANVPAQATLTLVVTPAVCGVDIDAYASCIGECEVDVTGEVAVTCEPGKLYGTCSGSCSGSCRGSCDASCEGTCSGSCTGSCTGSCYGDCSAGCSATNDQGECVGTCTGTCTGTCDGTCTGTCNATCDGACEGECQGECQGDCSVEFQQPRCDGTVEVEASAECEAACEADVSFEVECSEPEVVVELAADVTAAQLAELETLYATLEANLPVVLRISVAGTERLTVAADAFVTSLEGAGDALDAGAKAAACTLRAISAAIDASARINVSVMATVEISGSAGAEGMASTGP